MKKVVIFFICLFAVFTGFSQNRYVGNICIPYDEAKQDYGYTIIDTISQASDSSIYNNLKYFLSSQFHNNQYVNDVPVQGFQIQGYIMDSIERRADMPGFKNMIMPASFVVIFNMSVKIKYGRYKVDIDNLRFTTNRQGGGQESTLLHFFESNAAAKDIFRKSILMSNKRGDYYIEFNERVADKINEQITTLIAEMHNSVRSRIFSDDDNW